MKIKNFKFEGDGWFSGGLTDSCRVSIDVECGATKAHVSFRAYRLYPGEAEVHVDVTEAGNARGRELIQKYVERTTPTYAKAAHDLASQLEALGLD